MCDGETRTRDRTHTFVKLGEVQAKGYADPVPTYRPNLGRHQKGRMGSGSHMNVHNINRMETLSGTALLCCAVLVVILRWCASFVEHASTSRT